jgi:hypothetical protein
MHWFCPAFWWRDSNIYLVFSVFTSRPTSIKVSVSLFMVFIVNYHQADSHTANDISIRIIARTCQNMTSVTVQKEDNLKSYIMRSTNIMLGLTPKEFRTLDICVQWRMVLEFHHHWLGEGGACSNVVGWGTVLQTGRSWILFPIRPWEFLIELILPAALWSWGWFGLWQKWVPGIFLGVKDGRCVRLTTSQPSVSRLSRENMVASTSHNPMGLHGLLEGYLYLFFTDSSAKWHKIMYPLAKQCSLFCLFQHARYASPTT